MVATALALSATTWKGAAGLSVIVRQLRLQKLVIAAVVAITAMTASFARADEAASQPSLLAVEGIASFVMALQEKSAALYARSEKIRQALVNLPETGDALLRNLTDQRGWPAVFDSLGMLAVLLAGGIAIEILFRLSTRRLARSLRPPIPPTLTSVPVLTIARFAYETTATALFAFFPLLFSLAFFQQFDPLRLLVKTAIIVLAVIRLAGIVIRILLPNPSPLRFWLMALAVVASVGFSATGVLRLLGLPEELAALLAIGVGMLTAVTVIGVIWTFQSAINSPSLGPTIEPESALARPKLTFMQVWPLFATAYILAIVTLWSYRVFLGEADPLPTSPWGRVTLLAMPVADHAIRSVLAPVNRYRLNLADDQQPGLDRQQRLAMGVVQFTLVAIALSVLFQLLTGGGMNWLTSPAGMRAIGAAANIAVTLLIAYVVWEAIRTVVERRLRIEDEEALLSQHAEDEGGSAIIRSRVATLLPLFRTTAVIILLVTVVFMVLSSLGIDIAPLLAGAGVVGIAIGFGAQTLVRDILSGVFFLIDDAFRLGEYIEIDEKIRGEVERITLRSLQLRHHRGPLLTLPFGELRSITNHVRDWVIYKQEFPVPHDADVEKARKIIKKIGVELLADPEHGEKFLEPLKSQGIFRIENYALIIRTKFKCKPREQFVLRRIVFQRVKDALASNGIPLATPTVTVAAAAGQISTELAIKAAAANTAPVSGAAKSSL